MSLNANITQLSQLEQLRDSLLAVQTSLSLQQLVALLTIHLEAGLSVNELAERLKMPQQSASRHVAVLTGRYQGELTEAPIDALIVQQINEADPRRRALYTTAAGDKLVSSLLGIPSERI